MFIKYDVVFDITVAEKENEFHGWIAKVCPFVWVDLIGRLLI